MGPLLQEPRQSGPSGEGRPKTLKPSPGAGPPLPLPLTALGAIHGAPLCRCGRARGRLLVTVLGPWHLQLLLARSLPFGITTHFISLLCVHSWFPSDPVGSPHAVVSCPAALFPITHEDSAMMESSDRARCAASRAWVSSGLLDGWPHVSEQLSIPGVSFYGVGCGCQPGCWMHRFCNLYSHERPPGPLQGWCWM